MLQHGGDHMLKNRDDTFNETIQKSILFPNEKNVQKKKFIFDQNYPLKIHANVNWATKK